MKNIPILLASVLAIATVSAPANAIDAFNQGCLEMANLVAVAATRTHAAQPNGTTHAMADLAFCGFGDHSAHVRAQKCLSKAFAIQSASLDLLRTSVKLPVVRCATPEIAVIPIQPADFAVKASSHSLRDARLETQ